MTATETPGEAFCVHGNALDLNFLDDDSVDLVVTSPPYFGLRSYQDGGEHYDGQIGAEATPAEFVDALIAATREMMRVIKPSGSIWVNLGDKYSGYTNGQGKGRNIGGGERSQASVPDGPVSAPDVYGIPNKSLMGLPWRYAIRCIDDLGLILRAEVIWSKPNGLPESVTDRVRRSHETWFHFTKEPRYYSAVDEIREKHVGGHSGLADTFARPKPSHDLVPGQGYTQHRTDREPTSAANPLGKLPDSVWRIATEPLRIPAELGIDHFAAFPTEWPRRIITGWSPRGVCTACGEGRRPVAERSADGDARTDHGMGKRHTESATAFDMGNRSISARNQWRTGVSYQLTGYACDCPEPTAPTIPGVVLDPFGGTGTTALVASVLGRIGISVDNSRDYTRLAKWRVADPKQRGGVASRASSCSKCEATPGQKCVNADGRPVSMHAARRALGQALVAEPDSDLSTPTADSITSTR